MKNTNNKKITSTTTAKSILFAGLIMTPGLTLESADAHPIDDLGKWAADGTDVCFSSLTLDNVNINWSTGHFNEIKIEAVQSMAELSGHSDFWLSQDGFCISSDQWVIGEDLGTFGNSGEYQLSHSSPGIIDDATMSINTNWLRSFQLSGGCGLTYVENIEWLFNHEFGHWSGFDHHETNQDDHTMMEHECTNGWGGVTTDDAEQLVDKYGP